jgi:D-sedoheptulose 7-phosphate isomerase
MISARPSADIAAQSAALVVAQAHRAIGRLWSQTARLAGWGTVIHTALADGGLVMAAGNGGSATHADHLVGELLGRFRLEREPLRAVSLVADHGTLSAVANDYGFEEVFARQVRGLGRPGDVLVIFSTSGRSQNVIRAATDARRLGVRVLAFTGPAPNPLSHIASDALAVDAPDTASVQDAHHVALHALCAVIDDLAPTTPLELAP